MPEMKPLKNLLDPLPPLVTKALADLCAHCGQTRLQDLLLQSCLGGRGVHVLTDEDSAAQLFGQIRDPGNERT